MPGYPSARIRPRGRQMNLLNSTNEVLLKHTLPSSHRYQTRRNCCVQFHSTNLEPSGEKQVSQTQLQEPGSESEKRKAEETAVHRGNNASTEKPISAMVYCSVQPPQTCISRLWGACFLGVFFLGFLVGFFGLLWVRLVWGLL